MYKFPQRTPIKRTAITRPAVEASAEARAAEEEAYAESVEDRLQSEATPSLVEAEEALRVYHENILLVGEALLTLELMERGALDESEQRINALTRSYPDRESALLIRTLLNHWLSRTRAVSEERSSEKPAPVDRDPVRAEDSTAKEKTVASLKREGLNFYSRGDLRGAVSCWRRILELDPADAETRQFLQRAEAILRNRRAG